MMNPASLSNEEQQQFQTQGFLVKRQFADHTTVAELRKQALADSRHRVAPFELEADVHYPGAPDTATVTGGDTIRRLLLAYTRGKGFRRWANNPDLGAILRCLLDSESLFLTQSHHNCIMTKQPQFSSETHWHKDVRYWRFSDHNLVNTWLALGPEHERNGCLQFLPGSHRWQPGLQRLDEALFLRQDLPENRVWLDRAVNVELAAGDVLFFHAAAFHAAGRNQSNQAKMALVMTYHGAGTVPLPDTKSTRYSEVEILTSDRSQIRA